MNRAQRRHPGNGATPPAASQPEKPAIGGVVMAILDDPENGEALAQFAAVTKRGVACWPYLVAATPEEISILREQAQQVAANMNIRVKLVAFPRAETLEEFTAIVQPDRTLLGPNGKPLN